MVLRSLAAIVAVSVFALPAVASDWMGSVNFGKRGNSYQWSGSLHQGQNVIRTNHGIIIAVRDGKKVKLTGPGGSGKGAIRRGHFVGNIKSHNGEKASIHGTKSSGSKKGR